MDIGLKHATKTAEWALANSAAYKKFARTSGFYKSRGLIEADFFKLPIANKANYLSAFDFWDLLPNRKTLPMASASSGSSGSPTFWLRGEAQENAGARVHRFIFENIFGIRPEETTLAIICFSMGVWVAGSFTLACCRNLSRQGFNLTSITPGIEQRDIFHILDSLAPHYKNVILAGYPTFIMDALKSYGKQKLSRLRNIKILTSGEKFSEHWRDEALKLIGSKKLSDCLSLYGCADAGVLGFETPLSIYIRRQAASNAELRTKLFANAQSEAPLLAQYLPKDVFFEGINGELAITVLSGVPLIRYNLRDVGKILPFGQMRSIMNSIAQKKIPGSLLEKKWQLPFVIKSGRSDVGLTFYALNIYPENLKWSLEHSPFSKKLSGSFSAFSQNSKLNHSESFHINLELLKSVKNAPKTAFKAAEAIAHNLSKINLEFRKLYLTLGKQALPKIHLLKFGDKKLTELSKGFVWLKGKKPKMITGLLPNTLFDVVPEADPPLADKMR